MCLVIQVFWRTSDPKGSVGEDTDLKKELIGTPGFALRMHTDREIAQ